VLRAARTTTETALEMRHQCEKHATYLFLRNRLAMLALQPEGTVGSESLNAHRLRNVLGANGSNRSCITSGQATVCGSHIMFPAVHWSVGLGCGWVWEFYPAYPRETVHVFCPCYLCMQILEPWVQAELHSSFAEPGPEDLTSQKFIQMNLWSDPEL